MARGKHHIPHIHPTPPIHLRFNRPKYLTITPEIQSYNLLFQDDFSDGIVDGWNELDPGWSIQNGEYEVSQEGCSQSSHSIAGDARWSDYAFEFDIIGIEGTDKPVSFRYSDEENRYWFTIISKSSWGYEPLIRLGKIEDGAQSVLEEVDFDNHPGVWYHVRVEVVSGQEGEAISVSVDGKPVLSLIDEYSKLINGMIAWKAGLAKPVKSRFISIK